MSDIEKLLEIMAALRDPTTGCPWDLEQDFSTIAPYTIEEAYEVADAIERNDMPVNFDDIAEGISNKMLRRHPHVFGDDAERAAGHVAGSWDRIKAAERADSDDQSVMAGVARALPALKRAQKLGKRARTVGFDWRHRRGVHEKILEELGELDDAVGIRDAAQIEEEFGDLLFAIVNLARHLDVDPEQALSSANTKFETRFREMENAISESGQTFKDHTLETLDQEWRAAKQRLK
jgi:ATP diphosphatase